MLSPTFNSSSGMRVPSEVVTVISRARTPTSPDGERSFTFTWKPWAAASRMSRSLTASTGKVRRSATTKAKAKKAA